MKILVSNDDGIEAEGIKVLTSALGSIAEVYVFAPNGQRSAISHAITLGKRVSVKKDYLDGAVEAYAVSGTPADCVKLGLENLKSRGIDVDLVFAGINIGSNLGKDTVYSGTVGAAMEGAMTGILSVAISVDSLDTRPKFIQSSGDIAVKVAKHFFENRNTFPKEMFFNINVPNLPLDEIREMKWTILGEKTYADSFKLVKGEKGEDGEELYELTGHPQDFSNGNLIYDVVALQNKYASITPLNYDFTCHDTYEKLQNMNLNQINS